MISRYKKQGEVDTSESIIDKYVNRMNYKPPPDHTIEDFRNININDFVLLNYTFEKEAGIRIIRK